MRLGAVFGTPVRKIWGLFNYFRNSRFFTKMRLRYIKDKLIKKYLMESLKIPDYKADLCTAFAQGNMGHAIMLAN